MNKTQEANTKLRRPCLKKMLPKPKTPVTLYLVFFYLCTGQVQADRFSRTSETFWREQAQQEVLQGTVTDADGVPLQGVSIFLGDSDQGTLTDEKGSFSLQVNAALLDNDAELLVSFVGYQSQQLPIGSTRDFNIVLEESLSDLEEVVVVGYGTQRRKDVTGAIASVRSEELEKVQTPSFTSALQGKVPGVQIQQTSGAPGGSSSVRIRGVGTTGGNQPLYVVDGFPISSGSLSISRSSDNIDGLSVINPNDIESIEVLKDAASAAIYGARAANGVILVTTKRGKEGEARISVKSSLGFQQLWKKPSFLNATEFATLANELYNNSGMEPNPEWADPASFGTGTNWIDQVFRTAPVQNYNISASGGTEKLKTAVSLGYLNQQGTMVETDYERYTGRFTADLQASDRLKFGGTLAYTHSLGKGQQNQVMNRGIFNLAQQFYPTMGPEEIIDGSSAYYTTQGDNPLLRARTMDNRMKNSRVFGNAFGTYEIISGLIFRSSIGIDNAHTRNTSWEPTVDRGHYRNLQAYLNERAANDFTWLIENTLSYDKTFGEHNMSFLVGQTAQKSMTDWISATGREFSNEQLQIIDGSNFDLRQAGGTKGDYTLASYLARVNYAYMDKYLVSASIRRDGSSNFGPSNKWGNFPSLSAGWTITEEDFMQDVSFLNSLKLRASWGQLGNDAIGAFGYMSTIGSGSGSDNYVLGPGQDLVIGATLQRPGNPNLKWETTEQTNFGIDAYLFDNAISFTADYFIKNTKDMLVNLPISYEAGFPSAPSVNGGSVQNRGFEFSLGYQKSIGEFNMRFNANLATLKNEVLSLGVGRPINGPTLQFTSMSASYTEVGQPIGYYRGYVVDGIYQNDEDVNKALQPNASAGDFIFRDVNGDNVLSDVDRIKLGTPWPELTYGLNADFNYKGFDLNVLFQGVAGNQIFHSNKFSIYPMKYFGGSGVVNASSAILDRWTPETGGNDIPKLQYVDDNGNYANASSFYIEDGDYMRIRNILLGYTIPPTLLKGNTVIKGLRVYLNAQNLFTFTSYSGFDPEVGSTNPIRAGIDDGIYPQPRTFTFGINLTL